MNNSYDQVIFTWGKFKGTTLGNVLRTNPQYLRWICSSDVLPDEWVTAAKRALAGEDVSDLKLPRVKTASIQKSQSTDKVGGDILVYLVDKKTAYISMPYDRALIEQFKYEIDGRAWNKDDGRWEFPAVHLPKVQKLFPTAKFSKDAQELLDKLIDRRAKLDELREVDDVDITIKGFKVKPYGYQNAGIKFVNTAGGRALIADAPGLGKTLQAIAYAQMNDRKTLIVCPLSVVINWKREIEKFTGKTATIWDSQGYDGKLSAQFHIVHYDAVAKMSQYLRNEKFDLLVCDEATYLKNRKTIRAKSIFGSYAERRKYPGIKTKDVILLTGTPIMSRPVELFTLLNFLDKDRFNNFFHFVQRYGGWKGQPPQNLQELHDRIKDLVIRRKKENVLTDLPKKQRNELYVELTSAERKEYNKLLKELFGNWGSLGRPSVRHMPKLQSFLIDKKLPRLIEMIDEYLDNGQSILVFSNYLAPLRKLQEHYGANVSMITGEMDRHERQTSIDNLISKKSKIGAFSLKAAGMGINGLQEVIDTVVFLDFDWIVATHEQAEDRAHRIGQKNSVQSFYMICADTIDEVLRDILREKQEIADQVVDGEVTLDTTNKSMFKEFVKRISFMFDDDLDTENVEE